MKQLLYFISDATVLVAVTNIGIWVSILDWTIKIGFGLPSAIYICLKIYHEYWKKDEKNETSI